MKKIFKWILRLFLFLFLISLVWGVYFYFFPVYPDYGISEEYFETRFHEQWFDSPENGYEIWSNIQGLFTWVQWQVDTYSRCYPNGWDCWYTNIPEINDNNKEEVLSNFLQSDEYNNEYKILVENVLDAFDEMLSYKYISTHDYKDYEKMITGEEMKPILTFTWLIQFSRSLRFYYDYSWNKEFILVFTKFYKSLAILSEKLDAELIDYLVLITVLNIQFEYLENNIDRLNNWEKIVLKNTLSEYDISDTMIENALKWEYWYWKVIFEWIFVKSNEVANRSAGTNFKNILFYNHSDTMNLVRKNHYDKVNNICEENWPKKNGRNFLWRLLIETNTICFSSHFKRQEDLIKKREELIQLLSN